MILIIDIKFFILENSHKSVAQLFYSYSSCSCHEVNLYQVLYQFFKISSFWDILYYRVHWFCHFERCFSKMQSKPSIACEGRQHWKRIYIYIRKYRFFSSVYLLAVRQMAVFWVHYETAIRMLTGVMKSLPPCRCRHKNIIYNGYSTLSLLL